MKLFIPDIGEDLTLADNWRFTTMCESRNESLFNAFEVEPELRWEKNDRYRSADGFDHYRPKTDGFEFFIPADTVLKVDRVYIRKGMEDFSSITFIVVSSPDKRLIKKKDGGQAPKAIRFWVKLQETRSIEIE